MVSFQCHACGDVIKKPKLDQHRGRCHTGFDCIDCHTTFNGPAEYKGHTQCISEAEKYQKGLYKGPKTSKPAAPPSPPPRNNYPPQNRTPAPRFSEYNASGWGRGGGHGNNNNRAGWGRPRGGPSGANDTPLGTPARMSPVTAPSPPLVPPEQSLNHDHVSNDAKTVIPEVQVLTIEDEVLTTEKTEKKHKKRKKHESASAADCVTANGVSDEPARKKAKVSKSHELEDPVAIPLPSSPVNLLCEDEEKKSKRKEKKRREKEKGEREIVEQVVVTETKEERRKRKAEKKLKKQVVAEEKDVIMVDDEIKREKRKKVKRMQEDDHGEEAESQRKHRNRKAEDEMDSPGAPESRRTKKKKHDDAHTTEDGPPVVETKEKNVGKSEKKARKEKGKKERVDKGES